MCFSAPSLECQRWTGLACRAEQMDNSICVSRLLDGVADCSYISGGAVCKAQNQSRPIESEDITVSEDFWTQNILFNIYLRGHDFGTIIFLMNIGITPPPTLIWWQMGLKTADWANVDTCKGSGELSRTHQLDWRNTWTAPNSHANILKLGLAEHNKIFWQSCSALQCQAKDTSSSAVCTVH